MPIMSSLPSRGRWEEKSATDLPFPFAVCTITNCTDEATNAYGGKTAGSIPLSLPQSSGKSHARWRQINFRMSGLHAREPGSRRASKALVNAAMGRNPCPRNWLDRRIINMSQAATARPAILGVSTINSRQLIRRCDYLNLRSRLLAINVVFGELQIGRTRENAR